MAINVFFAPKGGRKIMEQSLKRLLEVERVVPSERLFVILWHLGSYNSPGTGDENAAEVRAEWFRLAGELEEVSAVRLLILMPEEPQDLSRYPRATFVFPDLLLKSVVRDQAHENWDKSSVLVATYDELAKRLPQCSRTSFVLWQGKDFTDSMLIRFCYGMAALPIDTKSLCPGADGSPRGKGEFVWHDDLFRFFQNPRGYRAEELHGSRPNDAKGDQGLTENERFWARKVSALEHLLSRVFVPQDVSMKVLVVENDFASLIEWDVRSVEQHAALWGKVRAQDVPDCFRYLANCDLYVVTEQFEKLRSGLGRKKMKATLYRPRSDSIAQFDDLGTTTIPWEDLDLVLQDVMLDKSGGALTGLHYSPYYLEACPQALVFVVTGMDVESLSTSGDVDHKYIDGIISKRKLGSLWWHYYQAFCQVFGQMFWNDFTGHDLPEGGFGGRQSLRQLFGSLRRWQIEPAVLAHGQGVAEMIDHAHRHIPALWRLADAVVGTLIHNSRAGPEMLGIKNRMLFAMGTWLHDIGHRGNEFTDDSGEVRMYHSGMSEYLLLRNPVAYGTEWLPAYCQRQECLQPPTETSAAAPMPHLEFRNFVGSCRDHGTDGVLCPLRMVGLLCRHHQSNAPLDAGSLDRMCKKGKFPSPYSRYKDDGSTESSQEDLEQWLDKGAPLSSWRGSGVRLLADFNVGSDDEARVFMAWVGFLRMLDGLQIHRSRVGSPTSLASFLEYLNIRKQWCSRELARLDQLLSQMRPGSKEYQDHISRRLNLERYDRLLQVQYVHWWRQLAVHDVTVLWHWRADASTSMLEVEFELDDAGLEQLEKLTAFAELPDEKGDLRQIQVSLKDVLRSEYNKLLSETSGFQHRKHLIQQLERLAEESDDTEDLARLWAAHVAVEMIWNEHESQLGTTGKPEQSGYLDLLPLGVSFRISVKGRTSRIFPEPLVLLEHLSTRYEHQS